MDAPPSPRKNKKTVTYLFQMFFPSFCFHHFYHQVLQPFHIFFGWILSSFSPSSSSFLRISIWSSWLFERNSTSSRRLLLHSAFFLLLFLLARILKHCLTAPFSHFFCMCFLFFFSFQFWYYRCLFLFLLLILCKISSNKASVSAGSSGAIPDDNSSCPTFRL